MLSSLRIDETELIFRLIDDRLVPESVTQQFLDWLEIERFALLDWMLNRWVFLREHEYHLPKKRSINLSNSI
jgi:hypothetical protein